MKKILLTAIAALVVMFSANAQINQGTILVGASSNLGFTSVSPDGGDSYSVFSLNAKGGYFFIDNLVGGLELDYDKIDDTSEFGFGVFGRYYINGAIITGLGIGTRNFDNGNNTSSSMRVALEGGYAAFINDNIAIEPTLNLDLYSGDFDATNFGFNVGFALYLGRD